MSLENSNLFSVALPDSIDDRDNGEKEIVIPRFFVASNSGIPEDFKYAWHIRTTPQTQLGNRSIPLPQGKLIGGGSGINGMVYDRGRAADYDSWADIGSKGWDSASLLPYFKKVHKCPDLGWSTACAYEGRLKPSLLHRKSKRRSSRSPTIQNAMALRDQFNPATRITSIHSIVS